MRCGQLPTAAGPDGALVCATGTARAWFAAYGITGPDLAVWLASLGEPGTRAAALMRRRGGPRAFCELAWAQRADRTPAHARRRPGTRPAGPGAGLRTKRAEAEVLVWVAYGTTNADIADILGMPPQ
ncbi:hypothetical protein [Acidiferrobacter sp.]|uniref:hypothetical protein n=1 Tax=Acidiferrobacter sp. TaxID=1872107 RepID=UPI002628C791|nr:hypothetical protein [Acidiferrobacter sp.]